MIDLELKQAVTRRYFFQECGVGIGKIALAALLGGKSLSALAGPSPASPLAPKPPHFR